MSLFQCKEVKGMFLIIITLQLLTIFFSPVQEKSMARNPKAVIIRGCCTPSHTLTKWCKKSSMTERRQHGLLCQANAKFASK